MKTPIPAVGDIWYNEYNERYYLITLERIVSKTGPARILYEWINLVSDDNTLRFDSGYYQHFERFCKKVA